MKTTKGERARWIQRINQHGSIAGRLSREQLTDLIADVDDAERLLERTRPILCGLAIEVEQKQKVEGTHYLTDAMAVKDEVVDFLKEPKQ